MSREEHGSCALHEGAVGAFGHFILWRVIDVRELMLYPTHVEEILENGGFKFHTMVGSDGFELCTALPFGIWKSFHDLDYHFPIGFERKDIFEACSIISESSKVAVFFHACRLGSTYIRMDKAKLLI